MTINLADGVIVTTVMPTPAVVTAIAPDPDNLVPITADLVLAGTGGGVQVKHQVSPSASWVFQHSLGRLPLVDIYLESGELVDADVLADSVNINVIFPTPFTGYLILR